jgi:hypothetical protein
LNNNFFDNKSTMIKWDTFGQHIRGTYGQFQKKNWQRYTFYTFPILFKKEIVFDNWPNECIPSFLKAMSTLILIFLRNEITFWLSCGFFFVFFWEFLMVFWEFFTGFLWWCYLAETSSNFLESISHLAEFSSHVAESSSRLSVFLTGF